MKRGNDYIATERLTGHPSMALSDELVEICAAVIFDAQQTRESPKHKPLIWRQASDVTKPRYRDYARLALWGAHLAGVELPAKEDDGQ